MAAAEEPEKCSLCLDKAPDTRLGCCTHSQFCLGCVQTWIHNQQSMNRHPKCPLCRRPLTYYHHGTERHEVTQPRRARRGNDDEGWDVQGSLRTRS